MPKHLVIVESPAKAKTLEKYLGKDYEVRASIGHIRDLPKSKLGVDVEDDFKPKYAVIAGKTKVISDLREAAQGKQTVLLASDPDREGEAIAYHLAHLLTTGASKISIPIRRVLFEEITKPAVLAAIKKPRDINQAMFESQQARRILDRLVGYQVSPILWSKVRRGLSAGRVQTVALRIICEREREIKAFKPVEYWSIIAALSGKSPPPFSAYLYSFNGERIGKDEKQRRIENGEQAKAIVADVEKGPFVVKSVTRKERKRRPVAPFITSRLQQEASRRYGYEPRRTMAIAQQLYEGIDIGEGEGPVGLITYMRTDSTRISPVAMEELRGHIDSQYGKKYLPESPNTFKSKDSAQEAHEAIRPTSVLREPEKLKKYLSTEQFRLYDLIWKRFVASQMNDAIYDQTTVDIEAGRGVFRATGQILKFDGFMTVYIEGREADEKAEEGEEDGTQDARLPELVVGDRLNCSSITPNQHFTQPPPRYSQATLIKKLEEDGIGRPSTYASIMSTILNREYVELDQNKRLFPTELGFLVSDLLIEAFPHEFDVQFTASMENKLDDVGEAKLDWVTMLKEFYKPFSERLEWASKNMRDVKTQEIETGLTCPKCQGPLIIRWGRRGEFLACKKYPECKFTSNFERDEAGKIVIQATPEPQVTDVPCPKCGKPTIIRVGRYGPFRGCSGYPDCKYIEKVQVKADIGMNCPICKKGDIVQRRSRWGKTFYGCSEYKKDGGCNFISNHKPVARACPKCNGSYLVLKILKSKSEIICPNEQCDFTEPYTEPENPATPAPVTPPTESST